jgi:hypothetical protein
MKIYTLTIGIDEENEQVEFIQEEQYETEPVIEAPDPPPREEDPDSWLDKMMKGSLNIIGHA